MATKVGAASFCFLNLGDEGITVAWSCPLTFEEMIVSFLPQWLVKYPQSTAG